jgi:hypothetical protein
VDLDRLPAVDAKHVDVRQSYEQLHHAFGVTLQRGLRLRSWKALTLPARARQAADPIPPSDPKCRNNHQ